MHGSIHINSSYFIQYGKFLTYNIIKRIGNVNDCNLPIYRISYNANKTLSMSISTKYSITYKFIINVIIY